MRKEGGGFNFIPELIGDLAHVLELSANPKALYIESAVVTLRAAVDVFAAFEEYRNKKRKEETKQVIQQKYENLKKMVTLNYHTEDLRRVDVEYEKVKRKIQEGKFMDKEVRESIKLFQTDLKKVYDILQHAQIDSDYPEKQKVEELARRTLRDYNKLLTIYIEEEEDGKD